MKLGKSLVALAQEIESQRERKKDFIVDTTAITVVPTGDAANPVAFEAEGVDPAPLRDLALAQTAEHLKIPLVYARRIAVEQPALLAENYNVLLHANPKRRLVRVLDGKARAFLSDKYQRIDNFDVANVALEALQDFGKLEIRSTEVTESRLYIKASLPGLTREVKSRRVGDFVEAGVLVTNSEVGLGAVTVTPFAYFLVCTNGMVRDKAKRWAHLGKRIDGDELGYLADDTLKAGDRFDLLRIRDALKNAFDETAFNGFVEQLEGATRQQLPAANVTKAIEVLSEKLVFAESERKSILTHLIEGGDLSRYGLVNAVTRTAEDAVDYDRATELEAAGHRVLALPANDWKQIAEAA